MFLFVMTEASMSRRDMAVFQLQLKIFLLMPWQVDTEVIMQVLASGHLTRFMHVICSL